MFLGRDETTVVSLGQVGFEGGRRAFAIAVLGPVGGRSRELTEVQYVRCFGFVPRSVREAYVYVRGGAHNPTSAT